MTTKITGNDPIYDYISIVFDGDISDVLGCEVWHDDVEQTQSRGFLTFSDGTILIFKYSDDRICSFYLVEKGYLFDRIEKGCDKHGHDAAYFKDGVRWASICSEDTLALAES